MFKKITITITFIILLAIHHPFAQAQILDRIIGNEPYERVDTPLPVNDGFATAVPPFARPEALFPHGFGMTDWLRDHGIAFLLDNMNEFAGAITKPTPGFPNYKQGASNAGQYAMSLNINWEKILGLRGFSTHSIAIGRYGTTANRMFGDWLNHSSEDYGGAGNVVLHLVMAYGEETLLGGRLDIAAGRIAEMSDFQNSPLFCNFQNGSICGRPKAATDSSFTSGYPASVWGGRIRVRPWHAIYMQTGVYAAERGIYSAAQNRTGFAWADRHINGVRVPFEIGFEPIFNHAYPGHVKIGGVLMTAPSPDNYRDANGRPFALSGQSPRIHRDSYGAWVMLDQHILNHYHNSRRGVTVMSGFLYNDDRASLRQWQVYGAFIDRGIFRTRPYDTFGVSFSYQHMPAGVQKTDELFMSQGKTLPNRATGIQRHASVMEVNYAFHVMRGVIFQPLMQYYFRPNGQGNLRDAALLGFKSHIEIF